MSATVLVSGAGGFVGSAVVRRLVRGAARSAIRFHDGAAVEHIVALIRPGGSLARLAMLPQGRHWSVEQCDVEVASDFARVVARQRPRAILHLAMDRAAYADDQEAVQRRAIEGPLETIFNGLAGEDGARVVSTSSAWVLPAGDQLDEQTPTQPVTPYARNKVRAERLLPILGEHTRVDWINLRLFNIFGCYESPSRLLPYLVHRLSRRQPAILANPDAIRDFTAVHVVADAYTAALAVAKEGCGATYHIGSGRGITIREFAMAVADVTGQAESIRFGALDTPDADTPCQVANPARAARVLGWSAGEDPRPDIRDAARWWLRRLADGTQQLIAAPMYPAR